jgi:hypothetical protein
MHHIFPSEFIFWAKAKNHLVNKNFLYETIMGSLDITKDKHIGHWKCNVNTEFFAGSDTYVKYIDLVVNDVYPALDCMFNEIPIKTPKSSKVKNIWYNYYEQGHNQEIHTHVPNSNLSGIYLLHLEEKNKTVFYSYNSSICGLSSPVKQLVEAEEGDIIIFPSVLLHYVIPCEKPRATIAFNIECTW